MTRFWNPSIRAKRINVVGTSLRNQAAILSPDRLEKGLDRRENEDKIRERRKKEGRKRKRKERVTKKGS